MNSQQATQQFRLHLAALLSLKYALALVSVWAFLWGTVVLALRAGVGVQPEPLLWGLAGVPLALALAVWLAVRRLPSRPAVVALIDDRGRCGGLLMAGEECALDGWRSSLPAVSVPRLRWQSGKAWTILLAALGFVLLSFLVPERYVALASGSSLDVSKQVEKLNKQIEVLKEEAVLETPRAEAMQKKLQQLHKEASGKDPVKTLEALDHVEDVTTKAAQEAAEKAIKRTEQLTKAQTMAEALKQVGDKLDPKLDEKVKQELAALAKKAAEEAKEFQKNISPETLKACQAGKLSPEDLKKLAEALKGAKGDMAKMLEKLEKAELIDADMLKKCKECGECKGDELAQFLKENPGNQALEEMLAELMLPGQGGVDRGRADAPLTWGEATREEGAKFKERILLPTDLAALKESKVVGLDKTAPKADPMGPSRSGALQGTEAGGGSANTQSILPRHRGAVERYFERPANPGK